MKNKIEIIEKSIWKYIEKYQIIFFFIIITTFSLILRIKLFNYPSGDYEMFLSPWFDELAEKGGLSALGQNIGNYTAPYMTILALLTYLPINSLISIKIVSTIFDFICAITVAKIVRTILKDNKNKDGIALLLYGITLFLPTVFLNSAYWGQADSIYTAFILISILFLIKEKYTRAFIFLGIASSFKLQFIFILPLYILLYISERKFSILQFLVSIIANIVMCIPSIIFGNSLSNCLKVYSEQVGTYNNYITLNFPNVYSIFFGSGTSHLIEVNNDLLGEIGIIFTIFIFILIAFAVLYKKVKFNDKKIIDFGLWSVLLCTFFLPHMHERYMFMGDILALVYFAYNKRKYYISIGIELISVYGYIHLLFSAFELEMKTMGIVFLITLVLYSKYMLEKYFLKIEKSKEVLEPNVDKMD